MVLLHLAFPSVPTAGRFLAFPMLVDLHTLSTLSLRENSSDRSLYMGLGIFNTLAFLGLFLNSAVLAAALLSPHIRRRSAWFSSMVAWIIYAISRLLILGHQTGSGPPYGTCLAQAVSVYATPSLCG